MLEHLSKVELYRLLYEQFAASGDNGSENIVDEKHGIRYETLSAEDVEEVVDLIARNFHGREPMSLCLEVEVDDIKKLLRPACDLGALNGRSIVAKDIKLNNKIVGALVSYDLIDEMNPTSSEKDSKFMPEFEIIEDLQKEIPIEHKQEKRGNYLYQLLGAVDPKYSGRDIWLLLMKLNNERAKKLGFRACYIETTGPISQHVVHSLGYQEKAFRSYEDFVSKTSEKKVFQGAEYEFYKRANRPITNPEQPFGYRLNFRPLSPGPRQKKLFWS